MGISREKRSLGTSQKCFPWLLFAIADCSVSRVLRFIGCEVAHYGFTFRSLYQRKTIYRPCTKQNRGDLIFDDTILHKNADKGEKKCGPGKDKALMKFTDSERRVLFKCDLFRNQSLSKEDLNDILLPWCLLVLPYFRVRQHFHYKPSGICNLAAL